MNAVVGTAAVALGLAGAVLGVVTLGLGLARHDTRLLRNGQRYVWVVLGGAVVATVAMQAALIGHDFSWSWWPATAAAAPAALHGHRHVVGPGGVDPVLGAGAGRLPGGDGPPLPQPGHRPAGGVGHPHRPGRGRSSSCSGWPGQPLPGGGGGRPARRPSQPAPPEPPAGRLPPAHALPGLRRVHHPLRLRHRRPGHRPAGGGMAGRDPPVDAVRLGLPHHRHHPGRMVVVRGPRVGRLLGLGPGGNASFLPSSPPPPTCTR